MLPESGLGLTSRLLSVDDVLPFVFEAAHLLADGRELRPNHGGRILVNQRQVAHEGRR